MATNTKSYNRSNTRGSYGTTRYGTGTSARFGTTSRFSGWSTRTNVTTNPNSGYSPAQFKPYRNTVQAKICSFRTLEQQTTGTNRVTTFSPTTFNRWINMVNKGCCVYKFTNREVARFCGRNFTGSTTTTLNLLKKKFGTGVKACTPTRNNTWLVCATQNVSATPFSNYSWK